MQSHWQSAESKNTIAAYEAFLKKYPESPLAIEARLRLEKLYWKEAVSKSTLTAYEEFVRRYPKSSLADKANSRIKYLKTSVFQKYPWFFEDPFVERWREEEFGAEEEESSKKAVDRLSISVMKSGGCSAESKDEEMVLLSQDDSKQYSFSDTVFSVSWTLQEEQVQFSFTVQDTNIKTYPGPWPMGLSSIPIIFINHRGRTLTAAAVVTTRPWPQTCWGTIFFPTEENPEMTRPIFFVPDLLTNPEKYIGKIFQLKVPVSIRTLECEYVFSFRVDGCSPMN